MDDHVSIVKCERYSDSQKAVDKALSYLGGMKSFVHPGDKVLIKPNYVMKRNPDEAATTHPALLHAVICAVEECGGKVIIAESPGGAYNQAILKGIYSVCGANEAIEGTNASLNFDCGFQEIHYNQGHTLKAFTIIDPVLDADVIISLPKLKTHAMTSYTGAVKNLFGIIPGTHKAEMHFRLKDRQPFCSMLVDLYECVRPTLSIMDGVWGMEGNGPTSGHNRHIGIIMASANGHALDMAACKIIGYEPDEVETVAEAVRRGLIPDKPDKLEILGEDINKLVIKDFAKPESHFNLLKLLSLPPVLNAAVENMLASRPKPLYNKCIGCGECMRCCPPKAINMKDHKPVIDKRKCIRCFCCQELCPKHAMVIHRPAFNRLMLKILK